MKNLILLSSLMFLLSSCDNPQRTRAGVIPTGNSSNLTDWASVPTYPISGSTSGTTTGGSTTGATTTLPVGFETCDLTLKWYAAGMGQMGICQSSTDETSIAIKTSIAGTNRTCLIPTYKEPNGSSTYIGQPQCFLPTVGTVMGKLYKTRTGYTTFPINGVMVMQEASFPAYYACMDAYSTYVSTSCPLGARTNPYCDTQAKTRMNLLCNDFKAMNAYVDVRLK